MGQRVPPPGRDKICAYSPSLPMKVLRMPRPGRSAGRRPSTTAPPPSPKSTQVLRSVQSSQALSFSAPTTSALVTLPATIMLRAISIA